ncbi:hypothetical protein ACE41H_17775 [Paenibacillus enshidis]|uniref:Uncharacterized protein n=1 Tax=Paenibacillus enshidis TaxID=1458439 RepID=A0ABV5AZ40_9BACL
MAFSREYAAKVILTEEQFRQTMRAQYTMYNNFDKNLSTNKWVDVLNPFLGVLGLVFTNVPRFGTPIGIATGIVSLLTELVPDEEGDLEDMVKGGYWEFGYIDDFFSRNPRYDRLEIRFPFLEYESGGVPVRFVTGRGLVTRAHSGSGWEILE